MSHHHHHEHNEHHHHDRPSVLSFEEKMEKLIEHWLQHNTDHAETYREWAKKAEEHNMTELGELLESVAKMTLAINEKFDAAEKLIKKV